MTQQVPRFEAAEDTMSINFMRGTVNFSIRTEKIGPQKKKPSALLPLQALQSKIRD